MKRKLFVLMLTTFVFGGLFAQQLEGEYEAPFPAPTLRAWDAKNANQSVELNKKPIPYVPLNESNILWSKRIWRDIPMTERMNIPLYYPLKPTGEYKSLFDVVKEAVLIPKKQNAFNTNTLSAYSDEYFTERLTTEEEVMARLSYKLDRSRTDAEGNDIINTEEMAVESRNITKVRVVEDWYLDKARSEFKVRIVAMTFIYERDDKPGADQSTFWIYYPEARLYLDNAYAYNVNNSAQRLTFEQIFTKRLFSSIIIKEDNVYDRFINQYTTSKLDALLEGQKINNELRDFEIDLWIY